MNPQVIKRWSTANAAILLVSLVSPWAIFHSDVFPSVAQYELGLRVLFYPVLVVLSQQPLRLDIFTLSIGLLSGFAPALALYYSICSIRMVVRVSAGEIPRAHKGSLWVLRLLLAAISLAFLGIATGFNSRVSWGYYLAIIGLPSSIVLEFISTGSNGEAT